MLDFEEIKSFFSLEETRLDRMMVKEYLQYKVLEILFGSRYGEKLIFRGGTSVRIVYGNDRFSEDLDLDGVGLSKDEFNRVIENLVLNLKREGFGVEYRNVYKGVFRCYLKFLGVLQKFDLPAQKTEKVLIQLDINQKKGKVDFVTKIINKFGIFAEVRVYPASILLSQKLIALFGRKRAKGRDLYDTVFLFSKTEPDWDLLEKEIGVKDMDELKQALTDFCKRHDLRRLARDVEPFLVRTEKVVQVEKFDAWVRGL